MPGENGQFDSDLITDINKALDLAEKNELGQRKLAAERRSGARKQQLEQVKRKEKREAEVEKRRQAAQGGRASVAEQIPTAPKRIDPRNIQTGPAGAEAIAQAIEGGRAVQQGGGAGGNPSIDVGGQTIQAPGQVVEGEVSTGPGRIINAGSGVFIGTPGQTTSSTRVRQNALTPGAVLQARVQQDASKNRLKQQQEQFDVQIELDRQKIENQKEQAKFDDFQDLAKIMPAADALEASEQWYAGEYGKAAETLGPASESFRLLRDKQLAKADAEIAALESQAAANNALGYQRIAKALGNAIDWRTVLYGMDDKSARMDENQRVTQLSKVLSEENPKIPSDWGALQQDLVPAGLQGSNPGILVAKKGGLMGFGSDELGRYPVDLVMAEYERALEEEGVSSVRHPILHTMGIRFDGDTRDLVYRDQLDDNGNNLAGATATLAAWERLAGARKRLGRPDLSASEYISIVQGDQMRQFQSATAGEPITPLDIIR